MTGTNPHGPITGGMMVVIEEKNWRVTARCNVCGGEFNVFSDDVALIKREIAAYIRKHERINHEKRRDRNT